MPRVRSVAIRGTARCGSATSSWTHCVTRRVAPASTSDADLTTVHVGLAITDEDWRVFMSIITAVLEELEVPANVSRDFVQLFEERLRATVIVG